ncbi:hypothetical protein CPB85DRAFT_1353813 [Mucidula mucida]|nr:hypothetical protein CPB85DRAFT_1353813 [Mucidula mucida]
MNSTRISWILTFLYHKVIATTGIWQSLLTRSSITRGTHHQTETSLYVSYPSSPLPDVDRRSRLLAATSACPI